MKSKSCLFWSVLTFISAAVIDVSGEEKQPYAVPGRFIVVLKQGHSPSEVANTHGLKPHHVYKHALNGFAAEVSEERVRSLREDPRVDFVEPELQLFSSAQIIPTGVIRIGANASPMAKIDGLDERVNADIAILDTGVAVHPDLNVFTNVSFVAGQTTDGNGHGTHVAGIAAALDNGIGVVGVAPGARLWAIKVMDDSGSGITSTVIQGIDYVTQNASQIEVANLSLVGIGNSSALRLAISNSVARGVVYVVSAGNDSRDIYGPDGIFDTVDDAIAAAYPEVMAVSALSDLDGVASADDALAGFSNYSRNVVAGNPVNSPGAAIDLAAPGVNIYSTSLNGGYRTMSGTSMAAPHVAGAVALYIAAHGRAANASGVATIRQALINSAQPQSAWGSANTLDPDGNREGLVYTANIAPPVNNPPAVAITAPETGSSFLSGSAITFTGAATDVEDGNRTANLIWTSSIDGQIGTGGSFSKVLSLGTHTITAAVTDSGGKTASDSITVVVKPANNAPLVTITAPAPGSGFSYNSSILFTGSASDVEDGNIAASLVWTSSINGQIGTGGSFSKVLSPGTHSITASATDSGGRTATASLTVTVLNPPQPTPTLSVSVATDKSSYVNRNKVSITATVTDGVNRVSGAAAHLDLTTPDGGQVSSDTTTDASGIARFQYNINVRRDGAGASTVKVTASKAGYNSGSGTTSYTESR